MTGDFFTIYDFGSFIPGSASAPVGWTLSSSNVGVTPGQLNRGFKARMAIVEAGDAQKINVELEKKRAEAPISVDWLMTAAALQIQAGDIPKAVGLVEQPRSSDQSHLFGLFAACAGDKLFATACRNHPELSQACRAEAGTGPSIH